MISDILILIKIIHEGLTFLYISTFYVVMAKVYRGAIDDAVVFF